MKAIAALILVLVFGILPGKSLGQTNNLRAGEDLPSVIAARCQLTPNAHECGKAETKGTEVPAEAMTDLAQRYPGPYRRPCCRGGYSSAYPPSWADDGHHAAIGALIGFGLGATAGATVNGDERGRVAASLLVGSLGALLGAAFGHAIPTFHARGPYRGPWPDEDDTVAGRQPAKPTQPPTKQGTIAPEASATVESAQKSGNPQATFGVYDR